MTDKLAEALDGARLVLRDEDEGTVYAWNGAHTVNIYSEDGDPLDVFTFGDFSRNEESVTEAERHIRAHFVANRCAYCGAVDYEYDRTPDTEDDAAWESRAGYHESDCEWIATRAHRLVNS